MPSISITQLNFANIGVSFILVVLALYFQQQSNLVKLSGLEILGGLMFIFSLSNSLINKTLSSNIAKRSLLVTFISALLVGFIPYISNINDNVALFSLANATAAIWLILLFITKYKPQ